MSEPAPETPKSVKHSTAKTTSVETEAIEQAEAEVQPAAAETQTPVVTKPAAPLIIHNRPSTWIAAVGIALVIFLFGYITGVTMSHSRTMRPMERPGMRQQEMRGNNYPGQNRGNSSNVPSV